MFIVHNRRYFWILYLEDDSPEPRDLLDVDLDNAGEGLPGGVVAVGVIPVDHDVCDPV